jgi:phospholipid/cholesterol/gamma-HCH transport system permease protein
MKQLTAILAHIGSVVLLALRALRYAPTLPRQSRRLIEQCYAIGYSSLPIVTILSFFIGSVLALQSGYSMQNFGAKQFIGALVGLSMTRELGPVMVAILIAGRVGSAVTAELASMKVYQEIDALVTMNIPPERMLVLPRLVAILVMMPVLSLIAVLCGWYGGALICQYTHFISVDSESYFAALKRNMLWKDVTDGLLKSEFFGFVIVLVCCHIGLSTRGGPREIGAAVTKAVVTSLILILVLDYFVTKALM